LPFTFKKLTLFLILIALLAVGLAYGLIYEFNHATSAKTFPTTATVKGTGDLAGLELTMTVEKTEYSLGEPINITLAVTNISNQTISVDENVHWDFYIFDNMNSTFYNNLDNISYMRSIILSNTTVYWYQETTIQLPLEWSGPLNAGQNLTETFVWGQTYYNELVQNVAVSPRTYYIVGMGEGMRTPPLQVTIDKT
jgi:hypothetical protein